MAVRRTQKDRREATVRRLFDATTEALIEVGYAGATVQTICARAGLSQGGLFRHFERREALMAAVGEDIGQRLLADYRRAFEAVRGDAPALEVALRLTRDHCRSRLNQAWYELAMAARTRPALRRALGPVGARYRDAIERLARELLPELALALGPRFRLAIDTVIAIFDGDVVHRFVVDGDPGDDAARLALVRALVAGLLG